MTDPSNEVGVIPDTVEPFKNVKITPTFQGLNTQEQIDDFINGNITIDDLRSLRIEATVSQNTETVEMGFADYTNLIELPNTDINSGYAGLFNQDGYLATVNDTTDTNTTVDPILNPSADPTVKYNHYPNMHATIPVGDQAECTTSECVWAYNYPVSQAFSGGQYEVQFTGYKSSTIQNQ